MSHGSPALGKLKLSVERWESSSFPFGKDCRVGQPEPRPVICLGCCGPPSPESRPKDFVANSMEKFARARIPPMTSMEPEKPACHEPWFPSAGKAQAFRSALGKPKFSVQCCEGQVFQFSAGKAQVFRSALGKLKFSVQRWEFRKDCREGQPEPRPVICLGCCGSPSPESRPKDFFSPTPWKNFPVRGYLQQ